MRAHRENCCRRTSQWGREIATYVYKHNLRRAKHAGHDDASDDEQDNGSHDRD
jgi:hypothetical protein